METKQFRDLLLFLNRDLQEKDIPHRTMMTKHILNLQKKHLESLSSNMLVAKHLIYYFIEG